MGRIFTSQEMLLGYVPHVEEINEVVAMLRDRLPQTSGFLGGILCGSAPVGNATRRGDVDGIIVFQDGLSGHMDSFMRTMHAESARRFVPLDVRTIPMSLAENGGHGVSISFGRHLHNAALYGNGEIGENPMPLFLYRRSHKAGEIFEYVARKLQQFRHNMQRFAKLSLAPQARFLQKMIEAPIHVARKALELDREIVPDDSRRTVLREYRAKTVGPELAIFERLVLADETYTDHLPKHLERFEANAYQRELDALALRIDDCLEFLRLILDTLAKR